MLDAKRLLDQFLGPQQAPNAPEAPTGGAAEQGSGGGFSVGNVFRWASPTFGPRIAAIIATRSTKRVGSFAVIVVGPG